MKWNHAFVFAGNLCDDQKQIRLPGGNRYKPRKKFKDG